MPQNRTTCLAAAACVVLEMICFLIKGLKNGFADKETLSKAFILRAVLIYMFALGLLAVAWFREFGLIGDVVISFCSVVAVKFVNKQFLGILDDEDDRDE